MADDRPRPQDWREAGEEAEAAYFASRYGLAPEELSVRAKLEAAARRLMD